MKLIVGIHGTKVLVNVLVDTGFTSGTGFGLQLPTEFVRYANYTGTGHVRIADGSVVAAASIPDAEIVQIEQHQLSHAVNIPAIFMNGPCGVIGVLFLQRCIIHFDGPNKQTSINF